MVWSRASAAHAARGRRADSLVSLQGAIEHSAACRDQPSILDAIASGLEVVAAFPRPELPVACMSVIERTEHWMTDRVRETLADARGRAPETVDPQRCAELRAAADARSCDAVLDCILTELGREIASY